MSSSAGGNPSSKFTPPPPPKVAEAKARQDDTTLQPSPVAMHQRVHLVGVVHDVQAGFVGDEAVTQFTLSTAVLGADEVLSSHTDDGATPATSVPPPPPQPKAQPTSGSGLLGLTTVEPRASERNHFTIRVIGSPLASDVRTDVTEGTVVAVAGQFRFNRQFDPSAGNRHFAFPFVSVRAERQGAVVVLYGRAKRSVATAAVQATSGQAANPTEGS